MQIGIHCEVYNIHFAYNQTDRCLLPVWKKHVYHLMVTCFNSDIKNIISSIGTYSLYYLYIHFEIVMMSWVFVALSRYLTCHSLWIIMHITDPGDPIRLYALSMPSARWHQEVPVSQAGPFQSGSKRQLHPNRAILSLTVTSCNSPSFFQLVSA